MLDHIDDLDSDFSAIHRIDDMWALDGPRFFKLAVRLPAYDGVMRVRVAAEAEQKRPAEPSRPAAGTGRAVYDTPDTITPASVALDPVLGSLISFGTGPAD